MKKILILILILCPLVDSSAESRITREEWHETIEDADYTESYKELKQKEKSVRRETPIKATKIPRWISITIISILLILLIILLVNNIYSSPLTRKVNIKTSDVLVDIDDPEKFSMGELDQYLAEALKQNDYRLAIRIHFLITMKSLKEHDLILWKKDKTNFDYLMELSKQEFIETFRRLVKVFEKVWYAEYELNHQQYQSLALEYDQLRSKLEN